MKGYFTLFLLFSISAKAQTTFNTILAGVRDSQYISHPSLIGFNPANPQLGRLMFYGVAKDNNTGKVDSNIEPTPKFGVYGSPLTTGLFSGITQQKADSLYKAELSKYKFETPTYTDHTVLPVSKSGILEFRDHEVHIGPSIINLSTTSLSAAYFKDLPVTPENGATITQNAIYQSKINGAGNNSWYVATAPDGINGVIVALNTSANYMTGSSKGAFKINTPDNTLQLAADEQGGLLGWTNLSGSTRLTLSADAVGIYGGLTANGSITSKSGLGVVNAGSASIDISSTSIMFKSDGVYDFVGIKSSNVSSTFNAFVIESNSSGGIYLNSFGGHFNTSGSIRLAINSNTVAKFTKNGFQTMKLHNNEILNIEDPEEGIIIYNNDLHNFVFYNGTYWRPFDSKTKLTAL